MHLIYLNTIQRKYVERLIRIKVLPEPVDLLYTRNNLLVTRGQRVSTEQKCWLVKFIIKKGGQAIEKSMPIHGESAVRALNDFFEEQSVKHGIFRSDIDVTAINMA